MIPYDSSAFKRPSTLYRELLVGVMRVKYSFALEPNNAGRDIRIDLDLGTRKCRATMRGESHYHDTAIRVPLIFFKIGPKMRPEVDTSKFTDEDWKEWWAIDYQTDKNYWHAYWKSGNGMKVYGHMDAFERDLLFLKMQS
jgi:hypothetical protein